MKFVRLFFRPSVGIVCVCLMGACVQVRNPTPVVKAGNNEMNTVNGGGGAGTGGVTTSDFDQFIHNSQPDRSGLYSYLVSPQPQDLKTVGKTKNRYYDAAVILVLNNDHTFNLFYEEYLVQKDANGNLCSKIEDGQVRDFHPHILNLERQGMWRVANRQLFLADMATGTRIAAVQQGVTLKFNVDINPARIGVLQGKTHVVTPTKYNLSYSDLRETLDNDVMSEDEAQDLLDKGCGKAENSDSRKSSTDSLDTGDTGDTSTDETTSGTTTDAGGDSGTSGSSGTTGHSTHDGSSTDHSTKGKSPKQIPTQEKSSGPAGNQNR